MPAGSAAPNRCGMALHVSTLDWARRSFGMIRPRAYAHPIGAAVVPESRSCSIEAGEGGVERGSGSPPARPATLNGSSLLWPAIRRRRAGTLAQRRGDPKADDGEDAEDEQGLLAEVGSVTIECVDQPGNRADPYSSNKPGLDRDRSRTFRFRSFAYASGALRYQRTAMPKRAMRGGRMPLTWFALAALWFLYCAARCWCWSG